VRVFLDTNVLVAAFATRGLCADLLRAVLAEHELLSSATVVEELTRTLDEKIRVPEATVREIAETGVHRISVGSLTKDVKAVDLSLRILNHGAA